MKFRLLLLVTILSAISFSNATAQRLGGSVTDSDGNPLVGAAVWWAGTNVGINTDNKGRFVVHRVNGYDLLVAGYLGFDNDTLNVANIDSPIRFKLANRGVEVEQVVVDGTMAGSFIRHDAVAKDEVISFAGLIKMACCNLAESFENSASVTVGYSDAISGARQIKMLGQAGIYTQILDESRPIMRGIGAAYGLSFTPGMWLNSIQVSKGVASVATGHEAITGQINLEHRKPTDDERFFLNIYFDQMMRPEVNLTSAIPLTKSKRVSTILMAHYSADTDMDMYDHNGDGFRDMPYSKQLSLANRWLFKADNGTQLRWGWKLTTDSRLGGMTGYTKWYWLERGNDESTTDLLYGSEVYNVVFNPYFKAAFPIGRSYYDSDQQNEVRSNIALVYDLSFIDHESLFGRTSYEAWQMNLALNLLYNHYFSYRSQLNTGIQINAESYSDWMRNHTDWMANSYFNSRNTDGESEIGAYTEYNYNLANRLALVAGVRADYNYLYQRWMITPRGHIKWNITPSTVIRASAGTGYRSSKIYADNTGILATGRAIRGWEMVDGRGFVTGTDNIDRLERALTAGGSLTQSLGEKASISVDYYHTRFFNQVVADQEMFPNYIIIYNSTGTSYTNTFQADLNWTPIERFTVLATARYNTSLMTLNRKDGSTAEVERPLLNRYKAILNLQYATRFRRWVFDFTAQMNGKARIPTQTGILSDNEWSPAYPMFFAQVSYKIKRLDLYLGCENIGDYTQPEPIKNWENPYSTQFNSMNIWGPLMGRKVYIGMRMNIY